MQESHTLIGSAMVVGEGEEEDEVALIVKNCEVLRWRKEREGVGGQRLTYDDADEEDNNC